jgi:hypothetical protein
MTAKKVHEFKNSMAMRPYKVIRAASSLTAVGEQREIHDGMLEAKTGYNIGIPNDFHAYSPSTQRSIYHTTSSKI